MSHRRNTGADEARAYTAAGPALGPARPDDAVRWLELTGRLGVDALLREFLVRLRDVPHYEPPPLPLAEIRRTARLSFSALIDALQSGSSEHTLSPATDVGVSRARAGVPAASLMTAVRLDFSVLWGALVREASSEDAALLVRHTEIVWRTVDEYAGHIQRAYMAERQRMQEEESSIRRGLLASMFRDADLSAERLNGIAEGLGLRPDEPLLTVAALAEDIPALRVQIAEAERAGAEIFTHHLGDELLAFTRTQARPGSADAMFAQAARALRVGLVERVDGIAHMRVAAQRARELALLLHAGERDAMTWRRGWARLAQQRLQRHGPHVTADVEAALASCGAAEQIRLREAVRSYLRTGSIGDSAAELFCHRNTLANRLRRFAEITGVDVTVPEQAARVVVGWA